jgi:hypothetical protein
MTLLSLPDSTEQVIRKLEIAQVRIPQNPSNLKSLRMQVDRSSASGVQIAPGLVKL